jgi:hypothetical protein
VIDPFSLTAALAESHRPTARAAAIDTGSYSAGVATRRYSPDHSGAPVGRVIARSAGCLLGLPDEVHANLAFVETLAA